MSERGPSGGSACEQPTSAHRRLHHAAVAALLLLQSGLMGYSAVRHSPTYDEAAQLPAGISHWRGDFRLFRVNPPLPRMISALPAMFTGHQEDWAALNKVIESNSQKRVDFDIGRDFIAVNGPRAFWLYIWGRWACVPLVTLGGWVVWRWSAELYGHAAGLLALIVWVFSPMILGHGSLMTPDVPAAACGVLALHRYMKWTCRGRWSDAYWLGLAGGMALLTKTTWLILGMPLLPLALLKVIWHRSLPHSQRRGRIVQVLRQGVLAVTVAWCVLLIGYRGDGFFQPLGAFPFQSAALTGQTLEKGQTGNRFADSALGAIRVPLPQQYVLGIDVQKRAFEDKPQSYLFGELRNGGWYHYYLVAVLVKTPIGWLLLLGSVFAVRLARRRRLPLRWGEVCLLLPLLACVLLVSLQTGINKHLRYLLPAYPLAMIWLSQVWPLLEGRLARGFVIICCAWAVGSSLWIYPHSLSYFNELTGGPVGGHRVLINSNIDWGQDLFFLKEKLRQRGWDRVSLAYWGRYDPRIAGIEFDVPPQRPLDRVPPGRYAISINFLQGYALTIPNGDGGLTTAGRNAFAYFQELQPVDSAGYSILMYEVLPDPRDNRASLLTGPSPGPK